MLIHGLINYIYHLIHQNDVHITYSYAGCLLTQFYIHMLQYIDELDINQLWHNQKWVVVHQSEMKVDDITE